MTPDTLEYLLRATMIWSVLLAFYLLVRQRTSFRFQRIVLLGGWLFGLVVPLLPALGAGVVFPVTNLPAISLTKTITAVTDSAAATTEGWSLADFTPWLYLLGVAFFGARSLVRWRYVERCLLLGQRSLHEGFTVVISGRVRSPFAARGFVFLPEGLEPALTSTALLHETAHLRARHHYDKALMTIASVLLWFHPLTWVYQRLLATVHEYEADAVVLRTVPAKTYGLQLICSAMAPTHQLGLFSSPLKKRIEMITSNPSRKNRFFPFIALVLLLGGLVVACSDATATIDPGLNQGAFYQDTKDVTTSMKTFLEDVYQEIKYPAAARNTGTEGKFRALMVIDESGKISELTVTPFTGEQAGGPPATTEITIVGYAGLRSGEDAVPEVLVEAIKRTLRKLDDFSPAYRKGVPSKNRMNLDFSFQLEE